MMLFFFSILFFSSKSGHSIFVMVFISFFFFFFSSRRRHTRCSRDWSSDVCSSDLGALPSRRSPASRDGPEQPLADQAHHGRQENAGKEARQGQRPAQQWRLVGEDRKSVV